MYKEEYPEYDESGRISLACDFALRLRLLDFFLGAIDALRELTLGGRATGGAEAGVVGVVGVVGMGDVDGGACIDKWARDL